MRVVVVVVVAAVVLGFAEVTIACSVHDEELVAIWLRTSFSPKGTPLA